MELVPVAAAGGQPPPAGVASAVTVRGSGDEVLRRMKAEHVKAQADAAFQGANYGVAAEKYSECIALQPGGHNDHRLLCNRSIALLRAGKHQLATADAQRACELAPDSSKAWYRLGAAQLGQRRATEALAAFTRGLAIQRGDMQLRAAVRDATRRMTREELAAWLLNALEKAEQQGAIRPPTLEDVSSAEKMEAMFRHVQLWQRDKPEPGDYYDYVALWSESPWSAGMALIHRSEMYSRAKCFAQAGVDAVAAIHFFESQQRSVVVAARRNPDSLVATHIFQPGTTSPFRRARIDPLAWSWFARGEAYVAEDGHAAQDWGAAAACYVRALDLDPAHPIYAQRLADASTELNHAQLTGVLDAVYVSRGGLVGRAATELGMAEAGEQETVHRCALALILPKATSSSLSAPTRRKLLAAVAAAAGVPAAKVLIDRVHLPSSGAGGSQILLQVNFGTELEQCRDFEARCCAAPPSVLGGADSELCIALGVPQPAVGCAIAACEAVDVKTLDARLGAGTQFVVNAQRAAAEKQVVAARPAKTVDLPYATYQLVRSDGRLVERVNKHPFALSRVYYKAYERPEEVWAGLRDGSCRWRQSASEVAVIALRVPAGLRKADLEVTIDLRSIRVSSRADGCVYLEGELERGIVPEESVWAIGGGEGEDGFVFFLKKMNLELIASSGAHSDSWWPRLFRHHAEIAWDDYEKDFSDLPEEIMLEHVALEYKEDCVRRIEGGQKGRHEPACERDDARRRSRQERLHVLRGGSPLSWVELDRLNPAVDELPELPPCSSAALLDVVRSGAAARQTALLAGVTTS